MTRGWRRAVGVTLLAVLLVVVGLVDRALAPTAAPAAPTAAGAPAAHVAAAAVESAAWYCPGGTKLHGSAPATVVLTNTSARVVRGTVLVVSSAGPRRSVAVSVPAVGRLTLQPARLVPGPWVSAAVTLDAGGVGATQTVSGPLGTASAPCASTTSRSWDFAYGSTAGSDSLSLALFNPTATAASVDVGAVTGTGLVQPPAFQEIQVPAGAVVVESLGAHVQQQAALATEVVSLSGSVVAMQLQEMNSAAARMMSLELGTPTPAPVWAVPQSTQPSGGNVIFHVLNPSHRSTVVHVMVADHQGTSSPVLLPVGPQSVATLAASAQTRIPHGTPFSLVLRTRNSVGIVVSRQTAAVPRARRPQRGLMSGVPWGARRWVVPLATPPGIRPTSLSVVATGVRPVRVRVTEQRGGDQVVLAGGTARALVPGAALVVGLSPATITGAESLAVSADGPVAIEVDGGPAGATGIVVLPVLTAA